MSHTITRLEKNKNREGVDEIFIDLQITDDLGTYNFGKWLTQEQFDAIKFDLGDDQFNAWSNLAEYNTQVTMSNALEGIATEFLPIARANYEASLVAIEEAKNNPPVPPEE